MLIRQERTGLRPVVWGGGPQPPRAVWEGAGASGRERGAGWGSPWAGGTAPCAPATGK